MYVLLRTCGIEASYKEVRDRRYETDPVFVAIQQPRDDLTTKEVLRWLQEQIDAEGDRYATLSDKIRILVSLATILFAATGVLLSRLDAPWIAGFSLAPLLVTVVLLVQFGGIGNSARERAPEDLPDQAAVDAARISSLGAILNFTTGTNSFLVDIYRAARRSFLVALFGFSLVAISMMWPSASSSPKGGPRSSAAGQQLSSPWPRPGEGATAPP